MPSLRYEHTWPPKGLLQVSWLDGRWHVGFENGLSRLKISKNFHFFWFSHILWVYLTRKTCGQHKFNSLNILGHPTARLCFVCTSTPVLYTVALLVKTNLSISEQICSGGPVQSLRA